jgi:hypothetical protein
MSRVRYTVVCRIEGGITGAREGPLKTDEGATLIFATREAAQAKCDACNELAREYVGRAQVRYWVEPEVW